MAYTVDSLIEQFRTQMDDNIEPYLWHEDRIVEWLDEAQKIFAERTKYFKGSESIAVLSADGGDFATPAYALEIRRAILTSNPTPLFIGNFNAIDRGAVYSDYGIDLNGDWEALTGTPRLLVLDEKTGYGRLVPKPPADDTIKIHYFRYPLKDITSSSSTLELTDTRHQRIMVVYARAMAYGDHDADVYDPKQEESKLAEFHAKVDVIAAQIKRQTRKAGTVKYGGL